MNSSRGAFLITAIIMIIFGIVLIAFPVFAAASFSVMVGVAFALIAISGFVTWLTVRRATGTATVPIVSILCLVMAIVCFVHPIGFASVIGWVVALCTIIGGVCQLLDAARAPLARFDKVISIVVAAIVIFFGLCALIHPALLVVYMGIVLVIEGIYFVFAAAHAKSAIIDVDSWEN